MRITLIIMLSALTSYFVTSTYKNLKIQKKCKAEISFIQNSERFSVTAFQEMQSNNGILSLSGELYSKNRLTGYISKTVTFSTEKIGGSYLVTSRLIADSPQKNLKSDLEKKWLPSFFYKTGGALLWNVTPINEKNYLISSEITPIFVCESEI